MIASITGTVRNLTDKYAVIETGGIGYKVYLAPDALAGLTEGATTSLSTYLSVREDALDLYGFKSEDERVFFELLLSVSGIGPKSALSILGITTIQTLEQAIGTGDTSYLTKVSGIGRKTAEKIVIELRDKLRANVDMKEAPGALRAESDVVEALKSLGYSQNEARDALKNVSSDILGTNARIKEALKILGNK